MKGRGLSLAPSRRPAVIDVSKLAVMFAALVVAMVALTSIEGAMFRAHRGEAVNWSAIVEGRLVAWITCAAFVPPLYLLTTWLPIGRRNWPIALIAHLLGSVLSTLGKYALLVPLTNLLDPVGQLVWLDELRAGFLGEVMFYWAVIGVGHAVFFWRIAPVGREATLAGRHGGLNETADFSSRISVPLGNATEVLETDKIDWISAEGNYVRIHMGQRQLLTRHTISTLLLRLPPHFVRVRRSTVINVNGVQRIDPAGQGKWRITLFSGAIVMSGRTYVKTVRNLLG